MSIKPLGHTMPYLLFDRGVLCLGQDCEENSEQILTDHHTVVLQNVKDGVDTCQ